MADKVDKPKKSKAKPKQDKQGVLAALPATRAERIGTHRASAPKTFEAPAAAQVAASPAAAAPPKPAASKKPAAKKPAARKPAAKQPGPRPAATGRKPVAPRTFEPTRAAETAAGAAPPPPPPASGPRPRAVREGAPGMGTSGVRDEPVPSGGGASRAELAATAAQAVGELTQAAFKVGGRIVKRAVHRLPKL